MKSLGLDIKVHTKPASATRVYEFFPKYVFWKKTRFFYLKWPLWPSISQKIFGGIAFSDPQQFSELENFGPLGVGGGGGGGHGEVS